MVWAPGTMEDAMHLQCPEQYAYEKTKEHIHKIPHLYDRIAELHGTFLPLHTFVIPNLKASHNALPISRCLIVVTLVADSAAIFTRPLQNPVGVAWVV